jgi:asparagine synthetase B (glutamine-hydrolysing)
MDTSDPDITFDSDGVSNWWHEFQTIKAELEGMDRESLLAETIAEMKAAGRGKKYDCLLGLSGGVDSSYMAYLAKKWGLRP